MNKTMIMNILTPLIASAATYLASKVPLLDQATWNTMISSIAVAGVTATLAYINREQSLKDTVGHMAKTSVVTDAASANALPNNPDVVAVTPGIVAEIKKAQLATPQVPS
jgi:hypothetical protein